MGWTGTYGLPRSLWLGDDGTLRMRPVEELKRLRMNEKTESDIEVPSGGEVEFNHMGSELMELKIIFQPTEAKHYGVKVCASEDGMEETLIYYDRENSKLKVDTRKSSLGFGREIVEEAPLELDPGESLVLRLFVDKSIVEVFANNRQAIARRIYPKKGGTGISLFSNGDHTKIKRMKAWELMPSNPC